MLCMHSHCIILYAFSLTIFPIPKSSFFLHASDYKIIDLSLITDFLCSMHYETNAGYLPATVQVLCQWCRLIV